MVAHYSPTTLQLAGTIAFLSAGAERMFLEPVLIQRVAEAMNYTLARILRKGVAV